MKSSGLLLFFAALLSFVSAQSQGIKGTVVLKLGNKLEGTITQLDLTGENNGLVYIETITTEITKKKRSRTSSTITEKNGYNPAIISRVIIEGKTYLFKDLRYGYDDKEIFQNCLVQHYFGNDSLAIYEWKNAKGETGYYVSTPRFTEYAEDINHPKYEGDGFGSFTAIKFSRCSVLAKKIYDREPGYFYDRKLNSNEEKLAVWKRIMQEYINCF
ncbi:MAG: hypothetical protein IPG86_04355 [Chitinophagaceae bacterium]|nr:hypothetical protein [Chitinophagaceae bacterium]